ncbi:MAG: hypothetical protein M3068_01555 [Gemmatimonadota bacterium]|nr:hypothetical protein [Gemmatimonadota bacterium]
MIGTTLLALECGGDRDSTRSADTALDRDLTLAGGEQHPEPALRDVPAASSTSARASAGAQRTPAPVARPRPNAEPQPVAPPRPSAPTDATPASIPVPTTGPAAAVVAPAAVARDSAAAPAAPGTLAAGTVLTLSPHIWICTEMSAVGDVFTATVQEQITGADGVTIPAGANAVLKLTSISSGPNGTAVMHFIVRAVGVTGKSFIVTADVPAGGAPSSQSTMADRIADFGSCVPRGGQLRLVLTQALRLVSAR